MNLGIQISVTANMPDACGRWQMFLESETYQPNPGVCGALLRRPGCVRFAFIPAGIRWNVSQDVNLSRPPCRSPLGPSEIAAIRGNRRSSHSTTNIPPTVPHAPPIAIATKASTVVKERPDRIVTAAVKMR